MRALLFATLAVAACTPDIASGSYLCGPNASCPEDQACTGSDNTCVLAGTAEAFSCSPDFVTEPDDTAAQAHALPNLDCVSVAFVEANCMLASDSEDWVKFVAPTGCVAVEVQARITFPVAFERLGFELWNLDQNMKVADDMKCTAAGAAGEEIRCLDFTLTAGANYGIKVHPAGDGNCDGACGYNRYTLRVQLATP